MLDVGVVPTPLTYFAANTLPVDGLAMITGSHNPPEYNGFKIGAGKTTFHGDEIQALRKLIEARRLRAGADAGHASSRSTSSRPYNHFVRQTVKLGRKGMRIVIDAGNGAGGAHRGAAASRRWASTWCRSSARWTAPSRTTTPTRRCPRTSQDLIAAVKREKAEVGIAYDGDADRIGVVDDKGNILWGDQLMILFARYVLKESPGAAIVGEVKCSQTLYDDIAKHGGKPIMWKAGHSLIKAKMKEEHAELAGEMSGHIFFTDRYFGFDDARLLVGAPARDPDPREARRSSELLADVPQDVTPRPSCAWTRRRRRSSRWSSAPPRRCARRATASSTSTACA